MNTRWIHRLLSAMLLLGAAPPARAQAQDAAEVRAFSIAARTFQDGVYPRAEREFAAFLQQYPASSRAPEAILYQARAVLRQEKLKAGIEILQTNSHRAGGLSDEFRYWTGEAHALNGNHGVAADLFAALARDFTNSTRLLEAGYGEALARFRLKEWQRTTELLQDPQGTFARAARIRASDELVARGQFLLGEALLELREYGAAEKAVGSLLEKDLVPDFKWRRQYLMCRIQSVAQRPREALDGSTNLLALAAATGQSVFTAESIAVQAEILQQLGEFAAAAAVLAQNLADTVPPDRRRRALLSVIELTLAQNNVASAAQQLETFLGRHPEDAASDVVLLTLGELHLRRHFSGDATNRLTNEVAVGMVVTNPLAAAQAQFSRLLKVHTNSTLAGKAWLGLGWCHWGEGRLVEGASAFQAAVRALPFSEDLAVARFKLADTQFAQGDFTNALANYRLLLRAFDTFPAVRSTLFDHALHQIARGCVETRDAAGAEEAVRKILDLYPDSFFSDRSVLLVGQYVAREGRAPAAREIFAEFGRRFPESSLLPEAELAVVRTHVLERNWEGSIRLYETWLNRFATNTLRPRAEFSHALATYKSGQVSNAFLLFTNFVARFPTNEFAPLAQYWVGTFHYDLKDYVDAQKSFHRVFENTNWPATTLSFRARMMAGRAAFARQDWNGAVGEDHGHFTLLIRETNPNCTTNLIIEALFAFGDTMTLREPDPANPIFWFVQAKRAFEKIPDMAGASPQTARALGRIGDCYLQMAGADPKYYADAAESYQRVIALASNADVGARSEAHFALGQVFEKQARLNTNNVELLSKAFDRYYDVVGGKALAPSEAPDPLWLEKAGLAAARLAEDRKDWKVAVSIYTRLREMLPPLRVALDRKIARAVEQMRLDRSLNN